MEDTLVTGGSGMVGSCVSGSHKPRSSELDLLNYEQLADYLSDNKIKRVCHCAGLVGGIKTNNSRPADFFHENMQMGLNVMKASKENGVDKVLLLSSTCAFPHQAEIPFVSGSLHHGEPHHTNYGYAYAKRMLDVLARSYRQQHGMDVISVIPCNIYGPRDNFNLDESHVVPGLIHKARICRENGEPLKVWGSGRARREFLFSEDVGRILDEAMKSYSDPEPLVISPPEETSIEDLARIIALKSGLSEGYELDNSMPDGPLSKRSCDMKFRDRYGHVFNLTPIEEGIASTVEWFDLNYEHARK